MKVDHYIVSENNVHKIVIQNHTYKMDYFKSDDKGLVEERFQEINEDIRKSKGGRFEILIALYHFAKNRGCITVWGQRGAIGASLKIKPEGKDWLLILARGKQEIILERKNNMTEIRNKYLDLLKKRQNDPTLYQTIWDYAMAKQKLELRDAK